MSDTVNLSPGSTVPETGKYKCEFCGEGGMADFFGTALKGSSFGLNTSPLEGVGRQSTVSFFRAGQKFNPCSTCGPATGWTLIQDAGQDSEKAPLRHGETVSESGVCDVCSKKVFRPNGYLLTTREVVSTPAYWEYYYTHHGPEFVGLGVSSYEDFCHHPLLRASCVEAMARQSSPWLVGEECISMFKADQPTARNYARRFWKSGRKFTPPGTGPASLSAINMGDGNVRSSKREDRDQSRETVGHAQPVVTRKWWQFWK